MSVAPTESNDDFRKRVNQRALAEEEKEPPGIDSDASEWFFGPDYRASGSLHTDILTGTAADLAERGVIACVPGERLVEGATDRDHSDRGARYALVVSIETAGTGRSTSGRRSPNKSAYRSKSPPERPKRASA